MLEVQIVPWKMNIIFNKRKKSLKLNDDVATGNERITFSEKGADLEQRCRR